MLNTMQTITPDTSHRTRIAATLAGLGMLGILGGLPINAEMASQAAPDAPLGLVLGAMVVQSAIMAGLAIWAFSTLGRRIGLDAPVIRTHAAGGSAWARLAPSIPLAAGLALGGVALAAVADLTIFDEVRRQFDTPDLSLPAHMAAILYGGIFEELLLRAGVMTVIAWALSRITRQPAGVPRPWIVWLSILGAALLFGAGHLAATAVQLELTTLVVARALSLNGLLGITFGWLAWRRGLEAAIVSHMVADLLLITGQHILL